MEKHKCAECGWVGTQDEMETDYIEHEDGGEIGCSVCPSWCLEKN